MIRSQAHDGRAVFPGEPCGRPDCPPGLDARIGTKRAQQVPATLLHHEHRVGTSGQGLPDRAVGNAFGERRPALDDHVAMECMPVCRCKRRNDRRYVADIELAVTNKQHALGLLLLVQCAAGRAENRTSRIGSVDLRMLAADRLSVITVQRS